MCGIAAIFNKNENTLFDIDNVSIMLETISHRGKDQSSILPYSTCVVGFNRLAITGLSTPQPQGKDWIIYLNGEIYNYLELGYSGSECEVLSDGFKKEGIDFVTKLNGMFVILAINGDDVYVFRDRYGIKPLYYYKSDDNIIFSSEIKAITSHPNFKFKINENVEKQWLTFNNCFTDDTLFDGIKKLDKGTSWHLNTNTKIKYWEWKFTPSPMNYEFAVSQVRKLVIQAIERQVPSEVTYGSCLSGGIDSNIITKILGSETNTFTAGFTEGSDESILPKVSSNNRLIIFSNISYFDETIYHLEDLRVGASWSNYGLYKLAAEHIKVLFDGAGADELFGGYQWRYSSPNYYDVLNRTKIDFDECKEVYSKVFTEDSLETRFKFDANYFLEGVLLVCDKLSMAHTIEIRVPYLDNDLVDFCLCIPNEYKVNKQILKDAFKDSLPETILNGKKLGFSSPDWFPGEGNQAKKWSETALKKWKEIYGTTK